MLGGPARRCSLLGLLGRNQPLCRLDLDRVCDATGESLTVWQPRRRIETPTERIYHDLVDGRMDGLCDHELLDFAFSRDGADDLQGSAHLVCRFEHWLWIDGRFV